MRISHLLVSGIAVLLISVGGRELGVSDRERIVSARNPRARHRGFLRVRHRARRQPHQPAHRRDAAVERAAADGGLARVDPARGAAARARAGGGRARAA